MRMKWTESKRKLRERETVAIVKGLIIFSIFFDSLSLSHTSVCFMLCTIDIFGFVLVARQLFYKQIDLNVMCFGLLVHKRERPTHNTPWNIDRCKCQKPEHKNLRTIFRQNGSYTVWMA